MPQKSAETLLFRPSQAAFYLGLSVSTLAKMRMRGDGPPYVKIGSRAIAYDRSDLEDWIRIRKIRSTSEGPGEKW